MKVRDIMTKDPACVTLETSLHDVAHLMFDQDCGSIPVTESKDSKIPVGVITDRDITIRTVAHGKNPLNMIAGEVMTDSVITVAPDATVEDCVDRMETNKLRRVLVVDENREICGIVAQADIALRAEPGETAELLKDVSRAAGA
ncbi:MAG: CBS domain-containing protein [Acidobacteriota bacterium]|nr:CBS domain-containing protein [Acidobacteriota bacterium]